MDGMGKYEWSDGRTYLGEYKQDKKHGYGLYKWADGRKYDGFWFKGRQHGLGCYFTPKDTSTKHGLWEDGKRIKWFTDDEVNEIKAGLLDWTKIFHDPASIPNADQCLECLFEAPNGFMKRIDKLQKDIETL